MHKSRLALATAVALAGLALPALSWDRDDDDGYYGHQYYRNDDDAYYRYRNYRDYNYSYRPYYDRPYYGRYDYDDWRRHEAFRKLWWTRRRYLYDLL